MSYVDYRKGLPNKPFDPNYNTDMTAFQMAMAILPLLQGTNHVWGMRDKYGTIGIYPRQNQPCQGGEMRKYRLHTTGDILHGDLCTEPDKGKPGDLYAPFPSGEPVFVGFRHGVVKLNVWKEFFEKSVYGRHLNPRGDQIHYHYSDDKNLFVDGMITTNTMVDPTMLVNGIQVFRDWYVRLDALLGEGIDIDTAIVICAICTYGDSVKVCNPGENYHFTRSLNLERFARGDFRSFRRDENGTLFSGEDYNRENVARLFECVRGEKPYHPFSGSLPVKEAAEIITRDIAVIRSNKDEKVEEVKSAEVSVETKKKKKAA